MLHTGKTKAMKEILHLCKLPSGLLGHIALLKNCTSRPIFSLQRSAQTGSALPQAQHQSSVTPVPPQPSGSPVSPRGSLWQLRRTVSHRSINPPSAPRTPSPSASFPLFVPRVALIFEPPWLLPWGATLVGFWVSSCRLLYKTSWLLPRLLLPGQVHHPFIPGFYRLLLLPGLFCMPVWFPAFSTLGAMDIHLIIPSVSLLARHLYIFRLLIFLPHLHTEKHDTWIMNFN